MEPNFRELPRKKRRLYLHRKVVKIHLFDGNFGLAKLNIMGRSLRIQHHDDLSGYKIYHLISYSGKLVHKYFDSYLNSILILFVVASNKDVPSGQRSFIMTPNAELIGSSTWKTSLCIKYIKHIYQSPKESLRAIQFFLPICIIKASLQIKFNAKFLPPIQKRLDPNRN